MNTHYSGSLVIALRYFVRLHFPQGFPRGTFTFHDRQATGGIVSDLETFRRSSDRPLSEHQGEIKNRWWVRWSAAGRYDVVYVPRSWSIAFL